MPKDPDELIPTRASLIDRLKNLEDQSGWQEFFATYWKLIYGVARQAGLTDAEAQDVVQETMFSVAKHMPGFKYDPAIGFFKAWLLKMTRWRIIDQLRKRGPLDQHRPISSASGTGTGTVERVVDPAGHGLDALWEAEWQQNLLEAALAKVKAQVDPHAYQLFDFYVKKEWPADKVAARFGVSVSQVYVAKHRVKEAIKAEVQRLEKGMS